MKNILWWLLFVVGVVGAIYAIPQVLTRTLNSEHPTLTVISRSMYPVLNRGGLILVKAAAPEEIAVGTVVVFRHKDGLAVHRVVRLQDDIITTRGDANPKDDQPITYDDIVGRVPTIGDNLLKIPLIGRISLLIAPEPPGSQAETSLLQQMARYVWNPLGFTMLVLLPAILFMEQHRRRYYLSAEPEPPPKAAVKKEGKTAEEKVAQRPPRLDRCSGSVSST